MDTNNQILRNENIVMEKIIQEKNGTVARMKNNPLILIGKNYEWEKY